VQGPSGDRQPLAAPAAVTVSISFSSEGSAVDAPATAAAAKAVAGGAAAHIGSSSGGPRCEDMAIAGGIELTHLGGAHTAPSPRGTVASVHRATEPGGGCGEEKRAGAAAEPARMSFAPTLGTATPRRSAAASVSGRRLRLGGGSSHRLERGPSATGSIGALRASVDPAWERPALSASAAASVAAVAAAGAAVGVSGRFEAADASRASRAAAAETPPQHASLAAALQARSELSGDRAARGSAVLVDSPLLRHLMAQRAAQGAAQEAQQTAGTRGGGPSPTATGARRLRQVRSSDSAGSVRLLMSSLLGRTHSEKLPVTRLVTVRAAGRARSPFSASGGGGGSCRSVVPDGLRLGGVHTDSKEGQPPISPAALALTLAGAGAGKQGRLQGAGSEWGAGASAAARTLGATTATTTAGGGGGGAVEAVLRPYNPASAWGPSVRQMSPRAAAAGTGQRGSIEFQVSPLALARGLVPLLHTGSGHT